MTAKKKYSTIVPNRPRIHKVSFMLNEDEHKTLQKFLKKYKITNKSKWYRETLMTRVIKTMLEDYPTLFDESEMR